MRGNLRLKIILRKWQRYSTVKTESETYKAKLLSKDSKIRNAAIHQLAQSGDAGQLDLLLRVLVDKRIGNGLSTAIKAIGDFQNTAGKNALIEIYGAVNDNDKKLVIAGLLKLGTFEKFFPAEAYHLDYYAKNPEQPYCRLIIDPKITKLYKEFKNQVKAV